MTPSQQKECAINFLKAMDKHETAKLMEMLADDFEYQLVTRMPGFDPLRGKQALEGFGSMLKTMMPKGFNFKFGTAISEGPHVALQLESDTVASNGRKYANRYHFYFRFAGDKIAEIKEYCDTNHVREVFAP
jgi:ketosteroid isomerase-like protein